MSISVQKEKEVPKPSAPTVSVVVADTKTAAPAGASAAAANNGKAAAAATATSSSSSSSSAATSSSDTKTAANPFPGLHKFEIMGCQFIVDAKYLPKKALGKGAYGVVCACVDQTTGQKVAIKKITGAFEDLVDGKRIVREIKLLRALQHQNIIKLYDLIPPQEHSPFNDVYMVFELADIDLSKSLQINRYELTDGHFQYFLYQLLRGLKYIHSANVLHRDIKPSNLLVYANCSLKICDFGLSRAVKMKNAKPTAGYDLTEYVVTRWYRPPEVICSSHDYDYKLDVWSVGCILAEFYLAKPLFAGRDNLNQMRLINELLGSPSDEVLRRISSPKSYDILRALPRCKPVAFKDKFPAANAVALDLLEKMLVFDPLKRISVDDALKHPYVAAYRIPETEIECPTPAAFEWESQCNSKEALRRLMWEEIIALRPDAAPKYERWLKHENERLQQQKANANRFAFLSP